MIDEKSVLNNEAGIINVLVALSIIVILGFVGLVIDIGFILLERGELVNAADAAVLAGAQELPSNPTKAIEMAVQYGVMNGVPEDRITIFVTENNSKIKVKIDSDVKFIFARVLGLDETNVVASSTAVIGPVTEVYDSIRPLIIEQQSLVYGQRVTLKENAGDGMSGNYGGVSLGGTGSKVFENNIKFGYRENLKIGDVIYTETGNMAGATYDGIKYIMDMDSYTFSNYDRDSLRIWTIPIVDSLDVSGNKPVTIIGFASFFVEDAYKQSGQTEITGKFIKFTTNGGIDLDGQDFGLNGIKLIN